MCKRCVLCACVEYALCVLVYNGVCPVFVFFMCVCSEHHFMGRENKTKQYTHPDQYIIYKCMYSEYIFEECIVCEVSMCKCINICMCMYLCSCTYLCLFVFSFHLSVFEMCSQCCDKCNMCTACCCCICCVCCNWCKLVY